MAEIAVPGHCRSPGSVSAMAAAGPAIDMLPNPDFSFPLLQQAASQPIPIHRRTESINPGRRRPQTLESMHRRGVSALPSFNFNSGDTSGLTANQPENVVSPPSHNLHKRNTSEWVGGGHGLVNAVDSSPVNQATTFASIGPAPTHRHKRSGVTMSSFEWSSVMTQAEIQPRLSSSLPNTPLECPSARVDVIDAPANSPFGSAVGDAETRPPSRPRVEFSDNVEYIPRPLSTISSETGSSLSTMRGHSLNNSISSVLSVGTPSPTSSRARATSLETTLEQEPSAHDNAPLELNKRNDREGQWLRTRLPDDSPRIGPSEPIDIPTGAVFDIEVSPTKSRYGHRRELSLGFHGFDRRRSEPAMGTGASEPSQPSALSLQETRTDAPAAPSPDRRSSSQKLKDWAVSKLSRKPRSNSVYLVAPAQPSAANSSPMSEPATAETDLDAVFSLDADSVPTTSVFVTTVFEQPFSSTQRRFHDFDDQGTMLDLDAALGPLNTPALGAQRSRRELHSSRGTRDFVGPGLHYTPNPNHRRTESAPLLTPFEYGRAGTPPQGTMGSVFEEDEEAAEAAESMRPSTAPSFRDEELGTGVQIVDSDPAADKPVVGSAVDDGLRIQRDEWELERPTTSRGLTGSRFGSAISDQRSSSVIADTILEESSPIEPTIVEAHEEPRASSLTKSSESSETPTVVALGSESLTLPDGSHALTTPESYQCSAFSTPDFTRRQSSFDTSRVGTSASSVTDGRTMSSCTTGEQFVDVAVSTDDVPSLTSSRSTMFSTTNANSSRRDVSEARPSSLAAELLNPVVVAERRRKRASIQSLSQLVGGSFGPRSDVTESASRPQTAVDSTKTPQRKEHRLKKLMFWKSKNRMSSQSTIALK